MGHDPHEDAKCCVQLVKLKIEQGLEFGKSDQAKASIFQRLKNSGSGAKKMASAYVGGNADRYGSFATTSIDCKEVEVSRFSGGGTRLFEFTLV
jgi:RNA exonuclease 1